MSCTGCKEVLLRRTRFIREPTFKSKYFSVAWARQCNGSSGTSNVFSLILGGKVAFPRVLAASGLGGGFAQPSPWDYGENVKPIPFPMPFMPMYAYANTIDSVMRVEDLLARIWNWFRLWAAAQNYRTAAAEEDVEMGNAHTLECCPTNACVLTFIPSLDRLRSTVNVGYFDPKIECCTVLLILLDPH